MALVDPGRHRHQFDRDDAELGQVLDDGWMGQRADGAAHAPSALRGCRMEKARTGTS